MKMKEYGEYPGHFAYADAHQTWPKPFLFPLILTVMT